MSKRKGRERKTPKAAFKPPGGKHPREPGGFAYSAAKGTAREPPMASAQGEFLAWHLGGMDFEGPFRCGPLDFDVVISIHKQLANFERMKWREVEGARHHCIKVSSLSKEARKRLEEIEMDDIEELFSLRLSGKTRVFGIRRHAILSLLWYDPDHCVCPAVGADN